MKFTQRTQRAAEFAELKLRRYRKSKLGHTVPSQTPYSGVMVRSALLPAVAPLSRTRYCKSRNGFTMSS